MALRTPTIRRPSGNDDDEEIEETEDDLIENYRYLTERCGALRYSPTTNAISSIQHEKEKEKQVNQSSFVRQYSSISETTHHRNRNKNHANNNELDRSFSSARQRCSPFNDLNNNSSTYSTDLSRIPPTIYYNDDDDDGLGNGQSFSLVKLFARMKARLKHDRRYRSKTSHELLYEEDPQEWYELTKNVRTILTKALLPDGGYDALTNRSKTHSRQGSCRKAREHDPVLSKDFEDEDKITIDIDDESNTEGDPEFDEIIWEKFLKCNRGFNYRRCGVCKAIDRQYFQGQLVFFYGVANNILIDENLKASGLG